MEGLGLVCTPLGKAREKPSRVWGMVGPFNGAEVPVAPKAMLMMEKIIENDLEKQKYWSESGRQDVEMREGFQVCSRSRPFSAFPVATNHPGSQI